jgi:hypothetical protein
MNRKLLWTASAFLLVTLLALQIVFHPKSNPETRPRALWVAIDAFVTAITYLVFAGVPAVILSLIPYKDWSYKSKCKTLFPATLFLILMDDLCVRLFFVFTSI